MWNVMAENATVPALVVITTVRRARRRANVSPTIALMASAAETFALGRVMRAPP
jgi:hypothetical protein